VALTFFAYLGFSVITFAAGDLADPARGLPKALYGSLAITACLYVLVALSVFGTLTVDEVVGYGETAIAEAARPVLGDLGFVMIAVAAMLATASSANASLYASVGLTTMLAQVGQFPALLGRRTRRGAPVGLLVTAAVVLVVSNVVDLSAIASVGSAVALCVFLLVAIAAFRRRADIGANPMIVLAAVGATAIVLVVFGIDTARNEPATFVAILAIAGLAIVFNLLWAKPKQAVG
jgi:amino acid transporter